MLWYLSSETDKRVIYILPGKNITIGRSVDTDICNFAISDDPSISRKHVTLSNKDNDLFLEDLGSKYGTFINDSSNHIDHNKKIKLDCNDRVILGKMGSVWKVNQINMVTCSSTLKGESLLSLRNNLSILGGVLKSDWDETCAYLTMPAITLTIKVVLALVQNSYIVHVDYWDKCVEAINRNTALPDPGKFVPHISEPTLNKESVSFLPSKERCSLFAGKKIIFFSRRQLEMYNNVLAKCSGTALLLSESKLSKAALAESDVLVIQYNIPLNNQDSQVQRNQINEITEYLNSKGKRIVTDAEIGLAVLYCSISKYCNPCFNFSSEVIKQVPQEGKRDKEILAQETQEQSQITVKKDSIKIDESLTTRNDHVSKDSILESDMPSSKRKWSEDIETLKTEESNKKLATDLNNGNLNDGRKRGADCDLLKPSKKVALENEVDNEGMFNFVEPLPDSSKSSNECSKKLNLLKPIKRKFDSTENDEDDLFNFVEDGNNCAEQSDSNTNGITKKLKKDNENHSKMSSNTEEKVDLSALRGVKLQELTEYNSNMIYYKHIKKEDMSEIDEKFSNINLGATVVVVKKDLIVKKEPLSVSNNKNTVTKNFKNFKKIWPIKVQISLASKSSCTTDKLNIGSLDAVAMNC